MKIVNEEHRTTKILTAIAIASLFIGSSKIMAIETYSENSFGVTEQMQAQTARGIIVDQNGEPIIGASILEKGTTNGVTTDLYGKFSLKRKKRCHPGHFLHRL